MRLQLEIDWGLVFQMSWWEEKSCVLLAECPGGSKLFIGHDDGHPLLLSNGSSQGYQ